MDKYQKRKEYSAKWVSAKQRKLHVGQPAEWSSDSDSSVPFSDDLTRSTLGQGLAGHLPSTSSHVLSEHPSSSLTEPDVMRLMSTYT